MALPVTQNIFIFFPQKNVGNKTNSTDQSSLRN
jgi:hypothetical protein